MKRWALLFVCALLGCATPPPAPQAATAPPVRIVIGLEADGRPSAEWIRAISDRVDAAELATIAQTAKPLSPEEAAWRELITSEARTWQSAIPRLNAPFRRVTPPRDPGILMGDQGGGDGFTLDPDDVAIDLGEMARTYGDVNETERRALIERLLSHEYTHLLLHRWLDETGWSEASVAHNPFRQALRTLFNEGIANLRSIQSPEWIAPDGALTPHARATLAALEPVLIARMQRLAERPPPDEAATLLRNISQGPLERKWGAIPVALWLAEATHDDPRRLAEWIEKKPDGVLELGLRYGAPEHRRAYVALIAAARAAAAQ